MALVAAVLPAWVYCVLAIVWIVTVLPLADLATMVLPFTLDTVSALHRRWVIRHLRVIRVSRREKQRLRAIRVPLGDGLRLSAAGRKRGGL